MIDRATVEHVAELARLRLTSEELERLRGQLAQILANFEGLQALTTDDIPPTAQVIPLVNVERPDAAVPSLPPEAVLANAPRVELGQFRVPAVLEDK
ncbi:MAG: Asp-tRNA(Asn)/Glu-tRNA(Gln) amidotransferase subunit GatC [Actinobacteria bacterium]|nr:Asp-tRNA(Asn)/Glu-tRNA(Gln) amidotransferase subunit GatC [Actinomycetota bacterium]